MRSLQRHVHCTRRCPNLRAREAVYAFFTHQVVHSRAHGQHRKAFFVCANFDERGPSVCSNALALPTARADEAIVAKIRKLLDPGIVQGAIADTLAELRPSREAVEARRRAALVSEIATVEAEQARVAEALAVDGHVEALAASLREREVRRVRFQTELAALDGADRITFDAPRVERELRRRVEEWRGLITRQTPIARQVLDRLLDERIAWTPHPDRGEYEYAGHLKFDRLLSGIVPTSFPEGLASPTGIAPFTAVGRVVRRAA